MLGSKIAMSDTNETTIEECIAWLRSLAGYAQRFQSCAKRPITVIIVFEDHSKRDQISRLMRLSGYADANINVHFVATWSALLGYSVQAWAWWEPPTLDATDWLKGLQTKLILGAREPIDIKAVARAQRHQHTWQLKLWDPTGLSVVHHGAINDAAAALVHEIAQLSPDASADTLQALATCTASLEAARRSREA